ncbi:MAG: hypothetical protein MI725_10965, partial [Pirellulales bacterium]|nr:hypothetical protein [Pirellulales bacterium]
KQPLPFEVDCRIVDGLDYDDSDAPVTDALSRSIQTVLSQCGYEPDTTLLHWHNHSLGKNAATPVAVKKLAEKGYRTLLQIHDFAEDFRPNNYRKLAAALTTGQVESLPAQLYPQAGHLHYATLNERDKQILLSAGVENARLHLLPNPVAAPAKIEDELRSREVVRQALEIPADARLMTYPVRGIRRKNLGELLLWSAVAEQAFFLVSLTPQSPAERKAFDQWVGLAQELNLPCRLGRPAKCEFSFEQLLAASDALVTTSIAEGFGMVFLEAWLVGKRLLGRNLPEISADFCAAGLDLEQLYDELLIPTEWIDRQQFFDCLGDIVSRIYRDFGLRLPSETELYHQLDQALENAVIDFARLPIALQREVILRVHLHRDERERLLELNPKLQILPDDAADLIAANAEVVRNNFSLAKLGERLSQVYAAVWNSPSGTDVSLPSQGQAVLETFLQMDRLHPVRVES